MLATNRGAVPLERTLEGVRVLVVDDEAMVRRGYSRVLEAAGATVVQASGGRDAITAVSVQQFDVILSDIRMPDADGIQVLQATRELDLDVSVVLITGGPDLETAMHAVHLGAFDYLVKPQPVDKLRELVGRAAKIARLARLKREALHAMGRAAHEAGDRAALTLALDRTLWSLWMAFQPIVRRDGSLHAYEVLMRSTDGALPGPEAILDAAERLGRLPELGHRTRELTAAELPALQADVTVFYNLHPLDLADPALLSSANHLNPSASRVVLEITERASLDGIHDVRRSVACLREQGFRIALDDLGAGYAGLTAFTHLEPDVAKLDMALTRDVDRDARKASVVGAMVHLCHDLGVTVVAEGVETAGEHEALAALDCDLFQGYLFARPAPIHLCGAVPTVQSG